MLRESHILRIIFATLIAGVLFIALIMYNAFPPFHLTILAGAPNTSYAYLAEKYREQLLKHGVELEIKYTAGVLENLEQMRAQKTKADVSFSIVGLTQESDVNSLYSLGGVLRGALWIFYKNNMQIDKVSELKGLRISTGAINSGTTATVRSLLDEGGALEGSTLLQLSEMDAVTALEKGNIDVIYLTGLPDTKIIQMALKIPEVRLMNVSQANAIALRDKKLKAVILPRGTIDLKADIPVQDISLLSASSSLIIRKDLHPALQYLLLEVAKSIHREPDVFQSYGEFPTPLARDLPLSAYAERFYRDGRPFLFDYLPFWAAALSDRFVWVVMPLLIILFPLLKLLEPTYLWLKARKLHKIIKDYRFIEAKIYKNKKTLHTNDFLHQLDDIEHKICSLQVPEKLRGKILELRNEIAFLRQDLKTTPNF